MHKNGNIQLSPSVNTIFSSGNVGIGTSDGFGAGAGVLSIGNATTAPTSAPSNAAAFYVSNGHMMVYDADGNQSVGSPHPNDEINSLAETDDPYPYHIKSFNHIIGKELVIDLGEAMRLLQTQFPGKKFIWYNDISKTDKNTVEAQKREAWKKKWIRENTREIEIKKEAAFEGVQIQIEDKTKVVGENARYKLEGKNVIKLTEPVYATNIELKEQLKNNVRFSEENGRFYETVVPAEEEAEAAVSTQYNPGLPKWITDRM